jgi:hypothetical protein
VTVYVVPFNGRQIKRAQTVDLAADFLRSSNAEAAAHLKIGAETVKHHLKLGDAQAQSTRSRASRRPGDSGRLDELTRAGML